MLDVRKMALLRELARLGTIAAVAQARFCTPSAVSQQLSALEREAGVQLLRRSGRGVALTAAGADLAKRTEGVLALLEDAAAALASAGSEPSGELRIGAFPTAVRTLLPTALVELGTAYPRLDLHVTELDPAQAPDALRAGLLDIALVHEYDYAPTEPDPALVTEPLLTEPVYLASAVALALTPGAFWDPILAGRDQPWIVGSPDTRCQLMAVRLCQAAGFTPRIRHFVDDFAAVLTLVAAGQGVAVIPELALADCPDGVALAVLPAERRTFIACRRGGQAHPAIAACAAAIRVAAAAYPGSAGASGARRHAPPLSSPSS
jgi:DNA-binding transcriptional LysR family regulator